jgi:glycosyltransferase involved in cell wall biosynthesis
VDNDLLARTMIATLSALTPMTLLTPNSLAVKPQHSGSPRRIALAHDWLVGLRGGEWVLDRLAQLFGPTDLYTLVDDGREVTEAISRCNVITSPLQRFPEAAGRLRRHYLPLMPWAVGKLKVGECDLLISTSSAVMKSIRPPQGVPHLCYCHSPARYIWEQTDDYRRGAGARFRSLGLRLVSRRFQAWDKRTAAGVTRFLANSAHTAARIKRCFDRDSDVVHPPVRTEFFTVDPGVQREGFLLVVSALEPYKRVDLVIEAANRAKLELIVAGDGSQRSALKTMAGPTVRLVGRVSDQELRCLYRRAKTLVFPQVEDFGIIAVEAQAAGCPVIAFAGGGAIETVTGQTGVHFDQQTAAALLEAIAQFDRRRFAAADCRDNALRFSAAVFDESVLLHAAALLHCQSSDLRR